MHRRLEATLDLAAAEVDADRLFDVLVRFHAFWAATEPVVDAWAAREAELAAALRWTRRRRSERLAADVALLAGVTGRRVETLTTTAALDAPDTADVLGFLYVSEGSTLGGAVITSVLRANPATAGLTLRSFAPYDEGPQPMWRLFLRVLEDWTGDDELRAERVVTAGLRVFTALADWTAPLAGEAAA